MERFQSWKEQKCILRSSYILHLLPCATNITVHGGQLPFNSCMWKVTPSTPVERKNAEILRYFEMLRYWNRLCSEEIPDLIKL